MTGLRSPTLGFVAQDLKAFLTSVVVGGITAALVQTLLGRWTHPQTAFDVAVASATTMTSAAHARFRHGQPLRALTIGVLVGVPLVYAAMRLLHVVLRGTT
jgi:hypothetical protein